MNIKNKTSFLYVVTGSEEEADRIATALVKEQLVACANILGAVSSIYCWKGEVTKETEVVVTFKTAARLVKESVKRIEALHSYECPAVIVIDIPDGSKEFLNWIERSLVDNTDS